VSFERSTRVFSKDSVLSDGQHTLDKLAHSHHHVAPEGTRAEADLPRFDKTIKTTLTLETRSASAEGAHIVGGKNRLLNVRQRASTVNVNN
jgi:hypothetical protein